MDPAQMRAAGWTYSAIARVTGISKSVLGRRLRAASPKTRCPWSARDNEILTFLVGSGASAREMEKALHRPASAIYKRAVEMGLGVGCPEGTELLTTAARRTGFSPKSLARIVAWAKIPEEKAFSRSRRAVRSRCYVVEDVDDAAARWLKTETVNAAATRLGVASSTLLRWLREAGVLGAGRLSHSAHRVESATIERVVRERRS